MTVKCIRIFILYFVLSNSLSDGTFTIIYIIYILSLFNNELKECDIINFFNNYNKYI